MSLQTLLEGWRDTVPGVVIEGLSLDSRSVGQNQAFVAVGGERTHGLNYVAQAEANGATVVIHDGLAEVPATGIPAVEIPGLGEQLSALAARYYHAPSEHLTVAGVTGTNGKTSVVHFIAQAWQRDTGDAGIIGTIGYGPLDKLKPAAMTTPDPISLQAMLAGCVEQNLEKVAMEVSSHALDQGRCDDVAFDAAVFTNLSP